MTKKANRTGYNLSESELRAVQLIELEMLVEVDRICRQCKIQYCISAGTMLGAVRHGGFIPWDDDADVPFVFLPAAMPCSLHICNEDMFHSLSFPSV